MWAMQEVLILRLLNCMYLPLLIATKELYRYMCP